MKIGWAVLFILVPGLTSGYLYRKWSIEEENRRKQYQKQIEACDRRIRELDRLLEIINDEGEEWMEKWEECSGEQIPDYFR